MRPPKPSLRKNKPTRRGKPGSYKLRLTLLVDPRKKGKLVELGLGTNDRQEAEERATALSMLWNPPDSTVFPPSAFWNIT